MAARANGNRNADRTARQKENNAANSAKKKPEERQRTRRPTEYVEQAGYSGTPMKVLFAIFCFGAAVLLLYVNFAPSSNGAAIAAIHDVMRGIGGSLSIVLSLICIWIGVLLCVSAQGKQVSAVRVFMHLLLFLCLFTAVQLFQTERVLGTLTLRNYSNYIAGAYRMGTGGGAIGALLAYPLYIYLGTGVGVAVVCFAALLALTANGYTKRFVLFIKRRAEISREKRREREEERLFDPPVERQPPHRTEDAQRRRERVRTAQPRTREIRVGDRMDPDRIARRTSEATADSRRTANTTSETRRTRPESAAGAPREDTDIPKSLRREGKEPAKVRVDRPPVIEDVPPEIHTNDQPPVEDPDDIFRIDADDTQSPQDAQDGQDVQDSQDARDPDEDDFTVEEADLPWDEPRPDPPAKAAPSVPAPTRTVVEGVRPLHVEDNGRTIVPEKFEVEKRDEDADVPFAPKPQKSGDTAAEGEAPEEYNYPPIDLLQMGEQTDITKEHRERDRVKAAKLIDTLLSFGIETKLIGIAHGPAVTRFELQPAPGVKVSRITSLSDDIALSLAALSVRIEAPIPGKAAVGVEIPNDKVEMVRLRDVLESPDARKHPSKLAVGLGKDNSGRYIVADIAKMPHVLIAGQTGSGKSVCINSIITSILYRAAPEEVRMILIDPKVVELSVYNDIPHLIAPVVTDPKKAASALGWAVMEMTRRYKCFADRGVRDIKGYNKSLQEGEPIMPQFVIIIDELADLMMVAPGEVEDSICRLAQLARAAGMHLVIATQRPSVNVITGIIKANIPTRIAFSVASQVDSRTMIDHGGAEKLLGNGDMLFVPSGINKQMRVQGAWVSDEEVHAIVSYIKARSEATYDEDVIEKIENSVKSDAEKEEETTNDCDPKLAEAVEIAIDMGQVSVSMLQRRMRVGYARAGRLVDEMEKRGLVSEADGSKPREVLITRAQYTEMFGGE